MSDNQDLEVRDCAICLQRCHYPTQLPCGHIFCFLCVKGVALQNKKCAMCRADIPIDYLDHPVLLQTDLPVDDSLHQHEDYQWYYEGRNGWWKYDERSNKELEEAYAAGDTECKLLLAGALYCVDLQNMVQVQSRDHTRRRRVKRDTPELPAKGIAGIKITDNTSRECEKNESEDNNITNIDNNHDSEEIVNDNSINLLRDEEPSREIHTSQQDIDDIINRVSSIDLHTVDQIPPAESTFSEDS